MAAAPPAIALDRVSRQFGALQAVQGVSLQMAAGERRAILGPNGAGKTTLFNLICGDYAPSAGRVSLFGEDITRLPAHRRTRVGIGRTYQNSLLLDGLSVRDNLYLAVRGTRPGRFSLLRARQGDVHRAAARQVAERVRLDHLLERKARDLSHGQRRQLEVGMALAGEPRLLMLDEPGAGLSPAERPELLRLLQELPRSLSLVLIEHDMDIALPVADRVTVMKDGEVAVESTPDVVSDHPVVRAIYLGGGARGGH
ncbi:ABC transporter ATP-binding protein [Methylibium petroleiphilum]|uniref:ABC transporter ATP-binding protein n=1 Tax=Methylibium petroleiphilum TaxID=105560 RepID=UPI001AC7CF7D|nr:ABC transporter ATP-binding protein [Methylibium petroleiphilum]MBN9206015.1 ABC transporter ATP-binding protein [Methylibium petroleiphilum]